jgi:hypothetical protein
MSVYLKIQFTAERERVADLEQALGRMATHVKDEHPRVLSTQCLRLHLGGAAQPTFVWMEEFASLSSMEEADRIEYTPGCGEVWNDIYRYVVAGTVHQEIWRDAIRESWHTR